MKTCDSFAGELAAAASNRGTLPAFAAQHLEVCAVCRERFDRLSRAAALQLEIAELLPQPTRSFRLAASFRQSIARPRRPARSIARGLAAAAIACVAVAIYLRNDPAGMVSNPPDIESARITIPASAPEAQTWGALRNMVQSENALAPINAPATGVGHENYRILDAHSLVRDASL